MSSAEQHRKPPLPAGTLHMNTTTTTNNNSNSNNNNNNNNNNTNINSHNQHNAIHITTTMSSPTNSPTMFGGAQNCIASPQLPGARKRILSEQDMPTFQSSRAYKRIINFISELSMATLGQECFPRKAWQPGVSAPAPAENTPSIDRLIMVPKAAAKNENEDCEQQQQQEPENKKSENENEESPSSDSASASTSTSNNNNNNKNYKFATPITPAFLKFFNGLHNNITEIPLERLHKSRFGNLAFRSFQTRLRAEAQAWLYEIVSAGLDARTDFESSPTTSVSEAKESLRASLVEELLPYLLDSFGNAMRIDFGTGHELHFLVLLWILHTHGCLTGIPPDDPSSPTGTGCSATSLDERTDSVLREIVLVVLDEYFRIMNRLQQHYRLEPAGSHGVWGLDDFHHAPYIFGAAQLAPEKSWDKTALAALASQSSSASIPTAPPPSEIPQPRSCEEMSPKNLFFRQVDYIHKLKSGSFGEHSPVLVSASNLTSWPKVLTGMIKMYEGEVLNKFLIVQHLLFGKTFSWN